MAGAPTEGADQTAAAEFSWDMAISRAEFERSLGNAFGPCLCAGGVFSRTCDGRSWRIELEPLPDRVIALLRLPRHRVSFRLEGYNPEEREAWIARFLRYFQRGGG